MSEIELRLKGKRSITKSPLFAGVTVFAVVLIINVILDPNFFSGNTIYSNLSVMTPVIIATMAQAIVIIGGNIDLSIGGAISLANCILASRLGDTPESVLVAFVFSLAALLGVGLLNGVLIAYFRLPSMIATFAVSTMLMGITLLILPVPGGYVPRWLIQFYQIQLGDVIPIMVFILAGVGILWWAISRTRLGRYLYAVGGNSRAASACGINSKKIVIISFLLSSLFIWFGSIVITAQTGAGDFRLGNAYTMTTIAAAIMGGLSLSGGVGKMLGAALGACVMILITNVIYFAGVQSFYQDMIRGLIIIISLTISVLPQLKKIKTAGE